MFCGSWGESRPPFTRWTRRGRQININKEKENDMDDWEKVELLDRLSAHDEEWSVRSGNKIAVGMYSDGSLVSVVDVDEDYP